MKAMILAAGHGKRMRPLTDDMPKPLLKVGGKPLLQWHIERLRSAGIQEFIINLGWKGWRIPEALGDGNKFGVAISYSDEQETGPLETAGGITKALPFFGNKPFLVVNGDIWCDYNYETLSLPKGDLAHLVLVDNPSHHPDGDFYLKSGRILEDNNSDQKYTFSGIGIYDPELFSNLSIERKPLAPLLYDAIRRKRLSGTLFQGDWRDIGTPKRLDELNTFLSSDL